MGVSAGTCRIRLTPGGHSQTGSGLCDTQLVLVQTGQLFGGAGNHAQII